MVKFSALMSIARMVEGDPVYIKIVKAHVNPEKLYKFLRENTLPNTTKLGGQGYVIEYGVIEGIEVEDNPDADITIGNVSLEGLDKWAKN